MQLLTHMPASAAFGVLQSRGILLSHHGCSLAATNGWMEEHTFLDLHSTTGQTFWNQIMFPNDMFSLHLFLNLFSFSFSPSLAFILQLSAIVVAGVESIEICFPVFGSQRG